MRNKFNKRDKLFFLILVLLVLYNFIVADNLSEYFNLSKHKEKISFFEYDIWISAIFLAPIIEELLFRLPLSANKKFNWMLIFPFIIFSIVIFYTNKYLLIVPILILLYSLYYCFYNSKTFTEFYISNKYFVIVFVSIAFSFMHIILYSDISIAFGNKVILVFISYLPISFALAYFRIKRGIFVSILMHSLFNLSSVILNHVIY